MTPLCDDHAAATKPARPEQTICIDYSKLFRVQRGSRAASYAACVPWPFLLSRSHAPASCTASLNTHLKCTSAFADLSAPSTSKE